MPGQVRHEVFFFRQARGPVPPVPVFRSLRSARSMRWWGSDSRSSTTPATSSISPRASSSCSAAWGRSFLIVRRRADDRRGTARRVPRRAGRASRCEKLAVEPARKATVVTLIIITIGASILIRGIVEVDAGQGFPPPAGLHGRRADQHRRRRPAAAGPVGASARWPSSSRRCAGSSSARASARPCSRPRTTRSRPSSSASRRARSCCVSFGLSARARRAGRRS